MAKIPKSAIKSLVKNRSKITLTDNAASAISRILGKKAERIAKYAFSRAKKNGRNTILKEDIDAYRLKFGE
ncbi:MAG: NFYB/HAP3 family transcription factor subunit [Candidatus Marsarchaeota archaeon]|jgi:histone H3/H4|nr:NFYB/HAP3 family transcription factor subunit [Candidatus Marsarchaeota archaeon]MCL5115239.1 NFYB/HAP3 family transcription factor subunit [Candidatus Marsarchaeota archaeon]